MQSGYKGGICGHSVSAFGNSVSMPIVALGLSGHCNGYRATVAVICNNSPSFNTLSYHSLKTSLLATPSHHTVPLLSAWILCGSNSPYFSHSSAPNNWVVVTEAVGSALELISSQCVNKERGSLGLEVTDFITVISSRLMSECKWAEGPLFMYM